ncbi:Ribonuclease H domain [Senna tora]|uniref:Ribonuclease H domain n=1 Tax=Senna tora TaxID=362788 RepID=A0A835CFW5_9FABA|nr:Ribonuclease H domain [Senna tora]
MKYSWNIWKQRNACIFNHKDEHASILLPAIKNQIQNYKDAELISNLVNQRGGQHHDLLISWKAPNQGWFKVNIDGSLR